MEDPDDIIVGHAKSPLRRLRPKKAPQKITNKWNLANPPGKQVVRGKFTAASTRSLLLGAEPIRTHESEGGVLVLSGDHPRDHHNMNHPGRLHRIGATKADYQQRHFRGAKCSPYPALKLADVAVEDTRPQGVREEP